MGNIISIALFNDFITEISRIKTLHAIIVVLRIFV